MKQRNTQQKKIIEEAVRGLHVHRTADEIHSAVKESAEGIGLATVYRQLNRMCEAGVIRRLSVHGVTYYDGNSAPHDHLYCVKCGKLEDVAQAENLQEETYSGWKIMRRTALYEGICEECLKKEGREKKTWN